jgi:hypothetical protein
LNNQNQLIMKFVAALSAAALLSGSVQAHGDHGDHDHGAQSVLKESASSVASEASSAVESATSSAIDIPTFTVSS